MMRSSKIIRLTAIVVIILFLIYFGFRWLYKLDVLPGLHGDEAWFGLKAHQFNKVGIDHLHGMNTYTGILQPLISSYSFKISGIGVSQLRIPGVFFNLLGLVIICITFLVHKNRKVLILFLVIFSQSALYLIAPRVAWEVNTFTLFFLSLIIASVANILLDPKVFRPFWSGLFLITNLLGTYNHIIFSCLSVAAFVGVVLWSVYNKSLYLINVIFLTIINLINVALAFITMKYWLDELTLSAIYLPALMVIILSIIEILILRILSKMVMPGWAFPGINKNITYGLLIVLLSSFIVFHGMALYQVMSNYKLILHAYSYPFYFIIKLLFLFGGGIICFYLFYFLLDDVKNQTRSLFAFFIITYLGILAIYTTQNSFRYYLSIYPVVSIYLALKMSNRIKFCIPLLVSIIGMFLLMNISLYNIFSNRNRALKAVKFTIGNKQIETSAHFLPNKPLIDFLKENKIDKIDYLSDQYFLEQPILFYRLIEPWSRIPGTKAIIGYDYSNNKHGGYMFYTKE